MREHGPKLTALALLALGCGSPSSTSAPGAPDGATLEAAPDDAAGASADGSAVDTGEAAAAPTLACEGGAPAGSSDAGTSNAARYFVTLMNPQNGRCLGRSLPVGGTGLAECSVLFALAMGDTCLAHPGLSAVAPEVAASVRTLEIVPGSMVPALSALCVLAQLPGTLTGCGTCATSTSAGWCYLTGSAAGTCPEAIAFSPLVDLQLRADGGRSGAVAYLDCAGASSSGAPASSAASVGASCVPSPELSASFSGFDRNEVTFDPGNAACTGGVCLVNHFQGLTGCPYGQDSTGKPPPGASSACTVPGTTTPVRPDAPVWGQTIQPQCLDRRASQTVYCSCRCANAEGSTADGASYCACPSGYACTPLAAEVTAGDPRAGSYCIRTGTVYSGSACTAQCDATLADCP